MQLAVKIKRDLITLYWLSQFTRFYATRKYGSALNVVASIEQLDSFISFPISSFLFKTFFKRKYNPADFIHDPYFKAVMRRFSEGEGDLRFLSHNIIVLKPYSPTEKGVLLLKYSEVITAFPFLFDMDKVQERYYIIIEPSSESPFHLFSKFFPVKTSVFVQSLSDCERAVHQQHGFETLPVCAGDWVNEDTFKNLPGTQIVYDFCVIANFIGFKRYPFLIAALSKYWNGKLKFAIIASKYVGSDKDAVHRLLEEKGLLDKVDIYSEVPSEKVNLILNQSHCHVLCSLREGANKASFESMISGTPAIVYHKHKGFPVKRFDFPLTNTYTNAKSMIKAIRQCFSVNNRAEIAAHAREVTGSLQATVLTNNQIKIAVLKEGGKWDNDIFRKINRVQAGYYNKEDAFLCKDDYVFLEQITVNGFKYSSQLAIEVFTRH